MTGSRQLIQYSHSLHIHVLCLICLAGKTISIIIIIFQCVFLHNSLPSPFPMPGAGHTVWLGMRGQPKVLHLLVTKHQQSSVTSWALWYSSHCTVYTQDQLKTCSGDEFVPSKGVNFGHSWVDGFCVFAVCFSN